MSGSVLGAMELMPVSVGVDFVRRGRRSPAALRPSARGNPRPLGGVPADPGGDPLDVLRATGRPG